MSIPTLQERKARLSDLLKVTQQSWGLNLKSLAPEAMFIK